MLKVTRSCPQTFANITHAHSSYDDIGELSILCLHYCNFCSETRERWPRYLRSDKAALDQQLCRPQPLMRFGIRCSIAGRAA